MDTYNLLESKISYIGVHLCKMQKLLVFQLL